LFCFPSSASDMYIHTAATNKGKASATLPSPSRTFPGVSVLHIPTPTPGPGAAPPLPLFLSPVSSPHFVSPNTPCTFHAPSTFSSYHSLTTSLPQSPHFTSSRFASHLSAHTHTPTISHLTPPSVPSVTPHLTPVSIHASHTPPLHPKPLRSLFIPLAPPLPPGAAAPVQPTYMRSFKSDLPDLSKIPNSLFWSGLGLESGGLGPVE
jgi:hypothetical protein